MHPAGRPSRGAPRRTPRRLVPAFTLIELMVSVALVLILILGVNAVFRMAGDTVHVGMAMSAASRDNRAVQTVLYDDLRTAAVTDGPFFVIHSQRASAFRSRADEQADRDLDQSPPGDAVLRRDLRIRTQDFDHDNVEGEPGVPGEVTATVTCDARNHRRDRLQFVARHLYRRQTGSGSSMIDTGITSNEAYVWYGHLNEAPPKVPEPPPPGGGGWAPFPPPTTVTHLETPSYTVDWNLGRVVILLRADPTAGGTTGSPQRYYKGSVGLQPIAGSVSEDHFFMGWSRYDVAEGTIDGYRGRLETYFRIDPFYIAYGDIEWEDKQWYRHMTAFRFEGTRYPDRPLTPYGLARTLPVLLTACSQFIVEYAGDYLRQDPLTGKVLGTFVSGAAGVDGEIDYVVVGAAAGRPARRVRWYGYPRNVDLSDDAPGAPSVKGLVGDPNTMLDVVPLRDVLLSAGSPVPTPRYFFEHFGEMPPAPDYGAPDALSPKGTYCAAWKPGDLSRGGVARPRMVRVTLVADDPQARMTEGQWYEYVMDVP